MKIEPTEYLPSDGETGGVDPLIKARHEALKDLNLAHGAARLFCFIIDLSTRKGSDRYGVVTVSNHFLARIFDSKLRTIQDWKSQLALGRYVWFSTKPSRNSWQTTVWHVAALDAPANHNPTPMGDNGYCHHAANNGELSNVGPAPKTCFRRTEPMQPIASTPNQIDSSDIPEQNQAVAQPIASLARNGLPATHAMDCTPGTQPIASEARNLLHATHAMDCTPGTQPIACQAGNGLHATHAMDCALHVAESGSKSPIGVLERVNTGTRVVSPAPDAAKNEGNPFAQMHAAAEAETSAPETALDAPPPAPEAKEPRPRQKKAFDPSTLPERDREALARIGELPGGAVELSRNGALWLIRWRENPGKLERVIADIDRQIKEGRQPGKSLGAWLTDTWRRFK